MKRKIKFVCNAVKWFDEVNGNTYHSVRVTRVKDGKVICGMFQYGYGECYKQTALEEMLKNEWIKCDKKGLYSYERENNYPILWEVHKGLKRECIANGSLN